MKVYFISKRERLAVCIAAICLLFFATILFLNPNSMDTVAASGSEKLLPIYKVGTDEQKVSISFDASWGATRTGKILDILDEFEIKTTFFLVNIWLEDYPDKAKEIVARGHEIGLHSVSHPDFTRLSEEQIKKELLENQSMIKDITGFEANLFRPPFGAYDNRVIQICNELNIYPIQWSIDSLDWKSISVADMVRRVTKAEAGDIVLFHNDGANTPEALEEILKNFQERKLRVVPISELIYKENFYIDVNGIQHRKK